jgi:hypothetical protein
MTLHTVYRLKLSKRSLNNIYKQRCRSLYEFIGRNLLPIEQKIIILKEAKRRWGTTSDILHNQRRVGRDPYVKMKMRMVSRRL